MNASLRECKKVTFLFFQQNSKIGHFGQSLSKFALFWLFRCPPKWVFFTFFAFHTRRTPHDGLLFFILFSLSSHRYSSSSFHSLYHGEATCCWMCFVQKITDSNQSYLIDCFLCKKSVHKKSLLKNRKKKLEVWPFFKFRRHRLLWQT